VRDARRASRNAAGRAAARCRASMLDCAEHTSRERRVSQRVVLRTAWRQK
jgi:hypothetical protein